MKRTQNLLLLFFLTLLLVSCQKTDDGSYTAPLTVTEKLNGTWKLTGIKQIDELAKANSIKPDEADIRSKFGFANMTLTLNLDADSLPTSYEVGGIVPELFAPSGYWDLDSPFTHSDGTPVEMMLYGDAAKTQITDVLKITTQPGKKATLQLKLTRSSDGTPYVSYVYDFKLVQ
jgi:hypothetical protein